MRRAIAGIVLAVATLAAIAPAAASLLVHPPTLVLHTWEGRGKRAGLYYDRIEVQMHPEKPIEFWDCRRLPPVAVVPPPQMRNAE